MAKKTKTDLFSEELHRIWYSDKTIKEKIEEHQKFLKTQTIFKKLTKKQTNIWYNYIGYACELYRDNLDNKNFNSWKDCIDDFEKYIWAARDKWNYDVIGIDNCQRNLYIYDYDLIHVIQQCEDGRLWEKFEKLHKDIVEKESLEKALEYIPNNSPVRDVVEQRISFLTK